MADSAILRSRSIYKTKKQQPRDRGYRRNSYLQAVRDNSIARTTGFKRPHAGNTVHIPGMRKTKSEGAEFKEWVCLHLGNDEQANNSEVARTRRLPRVGNVSGMYVIPVITVSSIDSMYFDAIITTTEQH